MYAVIKTGGKQYRVTSGETLKVEIIPGDVGSAIVLDDNPLSIALYIEEYEEDVERIAAMVRAHWRLVCASSEQWKARSGVNYDQQN